MDPTVAGMGLSEGNAKMDTVIAGKSLSGQQLLLETLSSKPVIDTCTEKNEEVLHSGAVGTLLQRESGNIDPAVAETRLHEGSVEMDMINARTNSSRAKKCTRKRRRTVVVNSENCCDAGDVSSGHDLFQESNPSSKDVADACIGKNEEVLHSGAVGTLLERENVNIVPAGAETTLHEGIVATDMVNARTNLSGAKKRVRKRGRRICAVNSENCCDAGEVLSGHDLLQESNPSSKIVADTCIEKNEDVLHSGAVVTFLQREKVNMDPAVGDAVKCCDASDVMSSHDLLQESNPSSKDVANTCIEKNEQVLHSGTVGTLLQRENINIDPARADTRLHEGSVEMDMVNAGTNVSGAKERRRKRGKKRLICAVNSENCCDVGDVVSGHDLLQESNPSSKDVADTCIEKNEEALHSVAVVTSLQRENINMDPAVGDVDAGDVLSGHDIMQENNPSSKNLADTCIEKNEVVLLSGAVGTLLETENVNMDPEVAGTRLHEGNMEMDTVIARTIPPEAKKRRRKKLRQICAVNSKNCCDVAGVLTGQDRVLESNPSSKHVVDTFIKKNEEVLHTDSVETLLQNASMEVDGSAKIIFPETNTERGPIIEETSFSMVNIDINPTADASIMDQSSVDAKQEYVKLLSGAGGNGSVSASNINSAALQDTVVLSQPPKGHSKIILLILDINGILADIVPYPIRGANKPDTMISNKALFKRPFCDEFLQFCFERFHVGIWSSRVKSNVDRAVDFLMGPRKRHLLFCWNQSHCTVTGYKTIENRDKPLVLKELRKLWDSEYQDLPWDKGQYNETNTLLLDDSPYKALRNPLHTGIFPCPYRYRNNIDNSLAPEGRLCRYLLRLSEAENVQKFVKENPIGQKPISEAHDSWSFYAKIVGREVSETEGKEMNGGSNVKTSQTGNQNEKKC